MRKIGSNDEAFTGLEAAIVLIAFVVVAAVFSYVMLGAGFFTSQKSQEVVHTSVAQTSSSMDIAGSVIGNATVNDKIGNVTFYVQLTSGGSPVDIDEVAYVLSTKDELAILEPGNANVVIDKAVKGDGDDLLEKNEMMKITVNAKGAPVDIGPSAKFTIDVKPSVGAALPIVRHAPPGIVAGEYYELV
ncbi:flagellin [Methanofollis formosanus]|uniref:Flagellin n=1 Tax=Methanofollis formosanus TaxID=299308 RepID=A0A8G1A3A8_9EURY|nr:archaellin/type IV pilin N-terminal domain-containing protein [Methanofollis formosanus]QYZ80256.1 flagellin [Methanofollis formosanus]